MCGLCSQREREWLRERERDTWDAMGPTVLCRAVLCCGHERTLRRSTLSYSISLTLSCSLSLTLSCRMLHAVIANIMLRFYSSDSFQLRFWQKVFGQLYEYLGKVRGARTLPPTLSLSVIHPHTPPHTHPSHSLPHCRRPWM
jgi:hypothetical protein